MAVELFWRRDHTGGLNAGEPADHPWGEFGPNVLASTSVISVTSSGTASGDGWSGVKSAMPFLHIRQTDYVADDAVQIQPLSASKFPGNREIDGEFHKYRLSSSFSVPSQRANSKPCSQIPYAGEQGV